MPARLGVLRAGDRDQYEPLAEKLALPLLDEISGNVDYLLKFTADRLELLDARETRSRPVSVDLLSKESLRRIRTLNRSDLLVRAVRFNREGRAPRLIDATAGLGEDGLCFASLGFDVTLIERNRVIFELLANGLARARSAGFPYASKLQLVSSDARSHLHGLAAEDRPDVIYIDPMYPPRRGGALGCKALRALRDVVGDDPDSDTLLETALRVTARKVVVKRPRLAKPLNGPKPHHEIIGRSIRYDIYLVPA